jgi:hypothetical protein
MRIGLLSVFLVCMTPATNLQAPVMTSEFRLVDDRFFATLDLMIPSTNVKPAEDHFSIGVAEWNSDDRSLVVTAKTDHQKGTLLTLMGLPASTMLDAFRISADHSVHYLLPIAEGQAVPCQVVVKSAFQSATINVSNAPPACDSMLEISGTVAVGPENPMINAWVTVTVDDVVFATIADDHGAYNLEIYSDSADALVTITAKGKFADEESVVHVYSGSIDQLLDADNLSASEWAVEIFGRKRFPFMRAAVDKP